MVPVTQAFALRNFVIQTLSLSIDRGQMPNPAMGSEDMAALPGKQINKTASQGLREQEVARISLRILSSLSDLMSLHGLLAESSALP